eukprot:35030-Prymnesium_polylepis.2
MTVALRTGSGRAQRLVGPGPLQAPSYCECDTTAVWHAGHVHNAMAVCRRIGRRPAPGGSDEGHHRAKVGHGERHRGRSEHKRRADADCARIVHKSRFLYCAAAAAAAFAAAAAARRKVRGGRIKERAEGDTGRVGLQRVATEDDYG